MGRRLQAGSCYGRRGGTNMTNRDYFANMGGGVVFEPKYQLTRRIMFYCAAMNGFTRFDMFYYLCFNSYIRIYVCVV